MSFSKEAKLEIIKKPFENDCCQLAFLYGLIQSTFVINFENGKTSLYISTDMVELYDCINNILKKLYGEYAEIEVNDDYKINKTIYYKISFSQSFTRRLLLDLEIIDIDEKNREFKKEFSYNLLRDDCCKKAFVKGVFIGSGTSSIKISEEPEQKTNTGYHIEFTHHSHELLEVVATFLAEINIFTRLISRKNLFVLYIKEASLVSDLLAYLDAFNCVCELNDEMVKREMRNKINRQTNCESGNITKIVGASVRQMQAITYINDLVGLDTLPEELQEIALLRLANPEESLDELINIGRLNLTKSGLNHRFKKIEKIKELLER